MRNQLFVLTAFIILSFEAMAQFTREESDIIFNGAANEPMRVLKVTDEADLAVLRKKCEDIDLSVPPTTLYAFVRRLLATLKEENGVGIAAPQVGICKNLFLFVRTDVEDYPVEVAINPQIVNRPEETICFENDGCLSVPDVSGNSVRYPWIEVEYTNLNGERVSERLEGHSRNGNFVAVIFQHEYDHLQGVLFTDKLCEED